MLTLWINHRNTELVANAGSIECRDQNVSASQAASNGRASQRDAGDDWLARVR